MRDVQFSAFFDQEDPQIKVDGMIASVDHSRPYELDAQAVFKAGHRFLVVDVRCSCWPDRGSTTQTICTEKSEVDKIVYRDLLQACQDANWECKTVNKKMTMELTLRVEIDPNGVSEKELRENLDYIVTNAMGAGLVTGSTAAEVVQYSHQVVRVVDSLKDCT